MSKNDGHLPAVGQSSTDKFRQERREKAAREKEEADRQKLVRTRLPSAPLVKRCGLRPRQWNIDGRVCCRACFSNPEPVALGCGPSEHSPSWHVLTHAGPARSTGWSRREAAVAGGGDSNRARTGSARAGCRLRQAANTQRQGSVISCRKKMRRKSRSGTCSCSPAGMVVLICSSAWRGC